ncbi:MAG: TrgA family protein [Pseudomonadota bacterium]
MPTAARLAGAVAFALFAWYLAGITIPFFPESNAPDYWIPAAAAVGLVIGWTICGKNVGQGYNPAIGIGLTCGAAMAFVMVFILAFNQMVQNSLRLRYDGPMEAVVDIFGQMLEFGEYFYDWSLIGTVLIGGVVCAWFAEFFGQRYP